MSIRLTVKQQKVYDFIAAYQFKHGKAPSYREIGAGVGLKSSSSVAEHVENLVRLGALRRWPGKAHSLEVVDITFPETRRLFAQRLKSVSEKEREVLLRAAAILEVDLKPEELPDSVKTLEME